MLYFLKIYLMLTFLSFFIYIIIFINYFRYDYTPFNLFVILLGPITVIFYYANLRDYVRTLTFFNIYLQNAINEIDNIGLIIKANKIIINNNKITRYSYNETKIQYLKANFIFKIFTKEMSNEQKTKLLQKTLRKVQKIRIKDLV